MLQQHSSFLPFYKILATFYLELLRILNKIMHNLIIYDTDDDNDVTDDDLYITTRQYSIIVYTVYMPIIAMERIDDDAAALP